MNFGGFLSCLCGSDLEDFVKAVASIFLSCLCGSDRKVAADAMDGLVSKLPMRQ